VGGEAFPQWTLRGAATALCLQGGSIMDLLRFLLRLPLALLRGAYWLLAQVFGAVSWHAPAWMLWFASRLRRLATGARAHPRRMAGMLGALVIAIAGCWFGYQWYRNLPRPVEEPSATFTVQAPTLTDYTTTPIEVHPLRIEFTRPVAPLALVGKPVTSGIEMKPEIAGKWTWASDHELVFAPKEDWPVGQDFDLRFDRAVAFAGHVKVDKDRAQVRSPEFTASVERSEFYQDPQDAAAKKAVIHLGFSHPVDGASLERRVTLNLEGTGQASGAKKFVVTYDERKLNAFIHSEPLAIPRDDGRLTVTVGTGVHAARGGPSTAKSLSAALVVPGLYSLQVSGVTPTLVDNAKFEPEQVLVVETSQAVSESDAGKAFSAFLLPEFNPKTAVEQRDGPYPWSLSEIGEDTLHQSQRLSLEAVPTEREFDALHSFKFHADPNRRLYVRMEKGLRSFGGYVLAKTRADVVQVPEFPRMLKFMADGALLSLNGEKRVSVVGRNVPGLELEVARVLPDQLQHLVSFNHGTYAKPELNSLNPDQITERFVQKIPFPASAPGKAHFEGVDLAAYLGKGDSGKRGIFLLKLSKLKPESKAEPTDDDAGSSDAGDEGDGAMNGEEGDDETNGDDGDDTSVGDSRMIVVTDLGVIAKKALDGTQDVFVQSIKTGAPVGDAVVDVVGRNGQTLFTQKTAADGRAHFDTLSAFTREKLPSMYVVRKGDDESFLPIGEYDRQLDFSRFDIGGERNARSANKLNAYLFSDRGIYRPGDTFHVGLIVRAADWAKSLSGIPLQAQITDARGAVVDTRKLRLNDAGFDEISYATQESSPTGGWAVNLYIIKDGKPDAQIGSVGLQVKEFLPDRMKAEARLSQSVAEGWIKPDGLKALFSLQNLFGTPAQNRRVEATLTLAPYFPTFHAYPGHRFFDPQHAKEGYSEPLGERQTDEHGEAEFPLDLAKYAKASYQLRFFAKGYEAEGGRNVAAETHALVSSLDYLIGAKTVDNLEFVTRGAKRAVNLIAIGPDTKKIAVDKLKAAIVERRFVSILTKQDSGVYKYESKSKEVPVSEAPLSIAAVGNDFDLPTDHPGNFALVIRNERNEELNRIEYAVAGEANVSRSLERNAELQLALSKHDFAPNEDVEIAIRAPYAGSGLITIERDKVFAHAWFHSTTTGSVQKIKVPADFEGNGYINVQFVRDPASDEIFMSPLSYGVVPFSVNRDARRDAVSVSAPALVKPGETLKMKVTATQPSRVVVFAVDEGILQVARYKLGDPLDFFFRKRMLEVRTSQILDLILPEFSKLAGMTAPGGDADDLLARHLNPFKKKHQQPVAYWSGIIDVKGERELSYDVPDNFNGRLRVMAVAVRSDKIGIFQNTTTVRGDFVLSPNVPGLVAPGDEFEVSVGVANNLTGLGGKEIPVKLGLDAGPAFEVVGEAAPELKLGEMREGVVVFRLRTKPVLGAAKLTFHASYTDKSAKTGTEVSVRPAAAYRTDVAFGDLDKGRAEVKPLRDMYEPFAKREIAAAYTPLVIAQGLSAYLADFPHRCTEQLVSQGVPALVFAAHPEYGRIRTGADGKESGDPLPALFAVLHTRQNDEGGFGLWASTPVSEPFVSAWTMLFLIEAKERGQRVPNDMFEAGNRYLNQLAADEGDGSLGALRERAFAAYLLTRQGVVTTNYLAAIVKRLDEKYGKDSPNGAGVELRTSKPGEWHMDGGDWHADDLAAWLAASMKLLKEDREADRLIAPWQEWLARASIENNYRFERYYDTLLRDSTVLYLLARHFPERARALPQSALANLVRPIQRGWFNTLSSAQTILALDAYAAQAGEGKPSLAELHQDGSEAAIATQPGALARGVFDASATALRVDNGTDLHAWYAVTQAGFDRVPPTTELRQGLEIVREYTNSAGQTVTVAKLGEELDVHLKIRATEADSVGSIAIVDLLPGGFEAVLQPPTLPEVSNANGGESNAVAPAVPAWHSPIGTSASTWSPEYADVRDDRVVIYGTARRSAQDFVYRIRATNAGTFVVPPAYGESLYDRTVQARSMGGKIEVAKK
jgi:alpha-2-macroglobulin